MLSRKLSWGRGFLNCSYHLREAIQDWRILFGFQDKKSHYYYQAKMKIRQGHQLIARSPSRSHTVKKKTSSQLDYDTASQSTTRRTSFTSSKCHLASSSAVRGSSSAEAVFRTARTECGARTSHPTSARSISTYSWCSWRICSAR